MDTRNRKKCHSFPLPLTEGVTVLGTAAFPVYLVRGRQAAALVETGIAATAGAVIGQLEGLGVAPDYLVVTHSHADHVTGLAPLRRRFPNLKVVAGQGAESFLGHPRFAAAIPREDRHMAAALAERGFPVGEPVAAAPSLEGAAVVAGRMELDLGGDRLLIFPVKGHAPGNVAAFLKGQGVLFASDSLGFSYPDGDYFPVFFTGLADYLATIDGLAALGPAVLALGHFGFFQGPAVGEALAAARRRAALLGERLGGDMRDEEVIVRELMDEFYRQEFTLYSRENITYCCRLLIRRSREEVANAR